MRHYIIDGNNLIGKMKSLINTRDKNKNSGREKLAVIIDRFFAVKKAKVSLHFDGFPSDLFKSATAKIIYSYKQPADALIRDEISGSKSPKKIILVTSDHSLAQFGKVNSCTVISSEEFHNMIESQGTKDEESERIKELDASGEEFRKLFERME